MKKIALIGLGPHAKRIYYPFIETLVKSRADIEFSLLVDLDHKKSDIETFIQSRELQPNQVCLLDSSKQIAPKKMSPQAAKSLQENGITHVIVATEPKAHKVYLEYCIKKALPVVVDKPVTAPTGLMTPVEDGKESIAHEITQDYADLEKLLDNHPKSRVLVQCQRRHHDGYLFVLHKLKEIVSETGIPITYINVHHSDGTWSMPDEYESRENHPYKYGYGKLMHSGYHFVDLLEQIQSINDIVAEKKPDTVSVFNQFMRPIDHLTVFNNEDYRKHIPGADYKDVIAQINTDAVSPYGEVDLYGQLQYYKDGRVVTTAQLSLLQSGFTQRAWAELPKDTYKGNGRVRHESVSVHVGPLMNIQVHSYQEAQIHEETAEKKSVGGVDHFDIYIFRNSNLLGGKPFELIEFGKEESEKNEAVQGFLGHNEQARMQILYEMLDGLPSNSELKSHGASISLLAALCHNQMKQQANKVPYATYGYEELKNVKSTFQG